MVESWKLATFFIVLILLALTITGLVILQVTPSVSNYLELQYVSVTHQFIPKIEIGYFTNAFFPINNKVPLAIYNQVLNGTYTHGNIISLQRYVATTGISAFPLTNPSPTISSSLVTPYTLSPSTLIYANNPSNLPNANSTFYYVYPIYEVQYNVNCAGLTPVQESQIDSVSSSMLKYLNPNQLCNNATSFNYVALVGISNNTATFIDSVYSALNPNYQIGTQNLLRPLSVYSPNGMIVSTDTAINGTLLGYASALTSTFIISNEQGISTKTNPIRNIFKGNLYTGQIFLSDLYCWNSANPALTSYFQTAKYTQYPYLYQYEYNSTTYLCLSLNSTDTILNATSNLDNSNFKLTSNLPSTLEIFNGTNYVIANQVAVADTYQYIAIGSSTTIQEPVTNKAYWFLPNKTNIFSLAKSAPDVFTEFTAVQYLLSSTLPILGQEPPYTIIPVNTTYASSPILQQAVVTNATTYLYASLIQNLTYQYIFNTTSIGTPVYCTGLCGYNGSLVYAEASPQIDYPYQYANPNFGFLELPALNQTVYYNPEIAIVAQTPFHNDTNVQNTTYGKLCLVVNQYSCIYNLTPSQAFDNAKNDSTFVIYGEGTNAVFEVNGQQITGWSKMESYLKTQLSINKVAKISFLNSANNPKWSVAGIIENINPDDIIIAPQSFNINPGAYPPATPVTYSVVNIVIFFIIIFVVVFVGYLFASIRLKKIFKEE